MPAQRGAVAAAVLAALLIVAIPLVGPLTREAPRLVASNLVDDRGQGPGLQAGETVCQDAEQVPADARRVGIKVGRSDRPAGPLRLTVHRTPTGPAVIEATLARLAATGEVSVRLPARHPAVGAATLCVSNEGTVAIAFGGEPAGLNADRTGRAAPTLNLLSRVSGRGARRATEVPNRLYVRYYGDGTASPLDLAGEIARRNGLWRGVVEGPAWMWLALGLVLTAGAAAVAVALRGPRRAIAWCGGVALVNAVAWSLIVPLYQVPDESAHVGYAQHVAETGDLPTPSSGHLPPADLSVGAGSVPFTTEQRTSWVGEHEDLVESQLGGLPRSIEPSLIYAANNPPLYYLIAAVPYKAARAAGGTIYDATMLMRAATALFAALLALLVFGFIREVLPGRPRAAIVGAMAVALHPMIGFLGGGVSPDMLLFCAGAGLFLMAARTFRLGITLRRGAAIGLFLGLALITKPAALGLVPGALVLAAAIVLRARSARPAAVATAGAGAGVAVAIFALWRWADAAVWGRTTGATAGFSNPETAGGALSLREGLSYLWQYYLPPLDSMTDPYPGELHVWQTWIEGFVGKFGWHQYPYPDIANTLGAALLVAVVILAAYGLRQRWSALRERWPEALGYVALLGGLTFVVHVAGYRYFKDKGLRFEQVRYLFPALLPIYGLTVALALGALRTRLVAPAVAFLLTLLAGHDLAGLLVTLQRYYV